MADNPLYPGYVPNPKDDPINPIYPGYFPGQAEVRPPKGGPAQKPTEFNFDRITDLIDEIAPDYGMAGANIPKWVVDRTIDDFKQNLKVSIKSADVKPEDLDDYDVDSLPGAFGLSLNINPIDWIQDPGKMAQKTIEGWWKSGTNWGDLETRYRNEVWNTVFSKNAVVDEKPGFKYGGAEALAVGTLGGALGAAVGMKYDKDANPLQMVGRDYLKVDNEDKRQKKFLISDIELDPLGNVIGTNDASRPFGPAVPEKGQTDLGAKFANSVSEFEVTRGFGAKREGKYDDLAKNGYAVVVTEAERHTGARAAGVIGSVQDIAAIKGGRTRLDLMDSMGDISFEISEYLKGAQKTAVKKTKLEREAITNVVSQKSQDLDIGKLIGTRKKIEDGIANMEAKIAAYATVPGAAKEAALLKRVYLDEYKKDIDRVLNTESMLLAKQAATAAPGVRDQLEKQLQQKGAKSVVNEISAAADGGRLGRPISGGDALRPAVDRILVRDSWYDHTHPGIRGEMAIGTVADKIALVDKASAGQVVRGVANFTRNESQIMAYMDVAESLADGNFSEKYIWPRVKSYWTATTPGAYAERFLKRNHYFGLNLADSSDLEFEKSLLYKAANLVEQPLGGIGRADKVGTLVGSMGGGGSIVPNRAYGNWFKINGTDKSTDVHITARLYGGEQFKGVEKLAKIWNLKDNAGNKIWSAKDFGELMNVKNVQDLKDLAGKVSSGLHLPEGVDAGDAKGLKDLANEIREFKKWVDENKRRIIATGVKEGSPEYYAALVNLLNAKNMNKDFSATVGGITRRYAGRLQKLAFGLNSAQSAVYQKFGKWIAPVAYARKIASDWLAGVITKALILISGAASGGTLAAIIKVIEPLLRFIINATLNKITDMAKVVYGAITQADFDGVFKSIDKSVEKLTKAILGTMGAIAIIFIAPAEKFMGTMAVSFSPVDNTIGGGITDMFGVNPQGSGVRIDPTVSKPSNVSDVFDYMDYNGDIIILKGAQMTLAPWPDEWRSKVETAIAAMKETTGGFLERLTDPSVGGHVNLLWAVPNNPKTFCGAAFGKNNLSGNDAILLGHGSCYDGFSGPDWYYTYLFAHETGHIYNYRYGNETYDGVGFEMVDDDGEGTMTTYPGDCSASNSSGEDFADTIGNWVQPNTYDCAPPPTCGTGGCTWEQFWQPWPKHREYADKVLTRP